MTIAIPLTVIVAVGIWVLLEKTKLGYELRATGCNKFAAKYCGMKEKRNIILTKAIAGGGALIDWVVHFLDIVMYCCGDPAPRTVSGETFCKLGKEMEGYVYKNMWAGPTK